MIVKFQNLLPRPQVQPSRALFSRWQLSPSTMYWKSINRINLFSDFRRGRRVDARIVLFVLLVTFVLVSFLSLSYCLRAKELVQRILLFSQKIALALVVKLNSKMIAFITVVNELKSVYHESISKDYIFVKGKNSANYTNSFRLSFVKIFRTLFFFCNWSIKNLNQIIFWNFPLLFVKDKKPFLYHDQHHEYFVVFLK